MNRRLNLACFGAALFFVLCSFGSAPLRAEETDRDRAKTGILSRVLHPNDPVLPSTVLGEEMVKVVVQVIAELPAEKKKTINEEKFRAKAIEEVRTSPCVLVTAAEESDFKAGKFDDARNLKMFKQFRGILTQMNVRPAFAESVFFREFDAGKLNSGVRLEAAARSAFMAVANAQNLIDQNEAKKQQQPPAPPAPPAK